MPTTIREYWGDRPCLPHEVMRLLNERTRPRWDSQATKLRPTVWPPGWNWWIVGGGVHRSWQGPRHSYKTWAAEADALLAVLENFSSGSLAEKIEGVRRKFKKIKDGGAQ